MSARLVLLILFLLAFAAFVVYWYGYVHRIEGTAAFTVGAVLGVLAHLMERRIRARREGHR